jgi:hypothetical protein
MVRLVAPPVTALSIAFDSAFVHQAVGVFQLFAVHHNQIVGQCMDTSQSGGVVGTPVIINHQNTSTYGKHISGTVGVGTQSNSSNMETIQIFVAYAHSTV